MFVIRWLSRLQAVKAVVQSYEALVVYFDDQANEDVTAEGIVKRLRKYRFVVCLCNILSTLGQLNKTFQLPTCHPCDDHRKIAEVTKALKSRYLQEEIRWGQYTNDCIEAIRNGKVVVRKSELVKQDED